MRGAPRRSRSSPPKPYWPRCTRGADSRGRSPIVIDHCLLYLCIHDVLLLCSISFSVLVSNLSDTNEGSAHEFCPACEANRWKAGMRTGRSRVHCGRGRRPLVEGGRPFPYHAHVSIPPSPQPSSSLTLVTEASRDSIVKGSSWGREACRDQGPPERRRTT
jgi:hypothetical protein